MGIDSFTHYSVPRLMWCGKLLSSRVSLNIAMHSWSLVLQYVLVFWRRCRKAAWQWLTWVVSVHAALCWWFSRQKKSSSLLSKEFHCHENTLEVFGAQTLIYLSDQNHSVLLIQSREMSFYVTGSVCIPHGSHENTTRPSRFQPGPRNRLSLSLSLCSLLCLTPILSQIQKQKISFDRHNTRLSETFGAHSGFKGAVSRYSVIFLRFFLREQTMVTARAQMSRTSDHDSSVSRANNFTAQAESSKYRFPRPWLVAAISFPHTKWLPKITDYRDTAALKIVWAFGVCCPFFFFFLQGKRQKGAEEKDDRVLLLEHRINAVIVHPFLFFWGGGGIVDDFSMSLLTLISGPNS